MTQQQLQAVIDGLFQFIEDKEAGHPFVLALTQAVQQAVDADIAAVYAWLNSKGLL